MSPRSIRRAVERKARKEEIRRARQEQARSAAASAACEPAFEDEEAAVQPPFISEARLAANRANAQRSTGPTTEHGKAIVSQNNFRHGLSGAFQVLPSESQQDFDTLLTDFAAEHNPVNPVECRLIEKMAQHFWLARRALLLQETCFNLETGHVTDEKRLALYLRYQTTHDRAFHKYSDELRKLRNEKRKAEIGFESQKRREAELQRREAAEARKIAAENRKQELHKLALLLAEAKWNHQEGLILDQKFARTMTAMAEEDRLRHVAVAQAAA